MEPSKFESITKAHLVALNTLILTIYRNWGAPREVMPGILRETCEGLVAEMRKEPVVTDDEIAFVQREFDMVIDSLTATT